MEPNKNPSTSIALDSFEDPTTLTQIRLLASSTLRSLSPKRRLCTASMHIVKKLVCYTCIPLTS